MQFDKIDPNLIYCFTLFAICVLLIIWKFWKEGAAADKRVIEMEKYRASAALSRTELTLARERIAQLETQARSTQEGA